MSSQKRKRSRGTAEDRRADCPFKLHVVPPPVTRAGKDRKRTTLRNRPIKNNDSAAAGEEVKALFQPSPFEPTGKFRAHATLGLHYHVQPRKDWTRMTRYHSFIRTPLFLTLLQCCTRYLLVCIIAVNTEKYLTGDFVFVANDKSIVREKLGEDLNAQVGPGSLWVAKILEIRALDVCHVYARVCWMYSPAELPEGRQQYHGKNEVIASNHSTWVALTAVGLC